MGKIYILEAEDCCEYRVVTATTDEAKANALAPVLGCHVKEIEDGAYDSVLTGASFFDVQIAKDGTINSVTRLVGLDQTLRSSLDSPKATPPYYLCVLAKDIVEAVKIANEKYEAFMAAQNSTLDEVLVISDIKWDTDGEDADVPKTVIISKEKLLADRYIAAEHINDNEELGAAVADLLSNVYGWCHDGFHYCVLQPKDDEVQKLIKQATNDPSIRLI